MSHAAAAAAAAFVVAVVVDGVVAVAAETVGASMEHLDPDPDRVPVQGWTAVSGCDCPAGVH